MTNQKLEELKKKIIEVVPEIMELKTGCRVKLKIKDDWFKNPEQVFTIARKEVMFKPSTWSLVEVHQASFDETNFEILGRDITLEDVLRAIHKAGNSALINQVGDFCKSYAYDNDSICQWILGQPLHLQSEETINYLHSIIFNRN